MKKILLLVLMSQLLFAGSAWSLTIDSGLTDVGSVDTFLFAGVLENSGDQEEIDWAEEFLKIDLVLSAKTDTEEGAGWVETNEDRIYAYNFTSIEPEYFLIKTGNLKLDELDPPQFNYNTFLYANVGNLSWGVIDLDDIEVAVGEPISIENIEKLSHIDEFNGGTPIPEPATLLLLGSGLIGLSGFRRKKIKK